MRRIAWATDIHLNFLKEPEIRAFEDSIAAAAPDVVVLSGDLAESHDLERHLRAMEKRLARPIYFVLGNHDYYKSSFADVQARVRALCRGARHLTWMNDADIVELSPETALIGHDAWSDGRNGDYATSPLVFSDWFHIRDFVGLTSADRLRLLNRLGDEAAAHFEDVLPRALSCFRKIVLVTHVPPFAEACRYMGHVTTDEWLPHLSCKAVGDVLRRIMAERPDRSLTVLSGHTHQPADVAILPNLRVRAGAASYGSPALQELILVA